MAAKGATADPFVGDPGRTVPTPFATAAQKPKTLGSFMGDGLVSLADVADRELQVLGIDGPHEGRFGEYLVVMVTDPDNADCVLMVRASGVAVVDALKRAKNSLAEGDYPIAATFTKTTFESGREGWIVR